MLDKNQLRSAAVKSLYRSVKVANHEATKTRLIKIASGIAAGKTISEAVVGAGVTGDTATALIARIAKVAMHDAANLEKKAGPFRRIANNIRSRRATRRAPAPVTTTAPTVAPTPTAAEAPAPMPEATPATTQQPKKPFGLPAPEPVNPVWEAAMNRRNTAADRAKYDAAFDEVFGASPATSTSSAQPLSPEALGEQARAAIEPSSYSQLSTMAPSSLFKQVPTSQSADPVNQALGLTSAATAPLPAAANALLSSPLSRISRNDFNTAQQTNDIAATAVSPLPTIARLLSQNQPQRSSQPQLAQAVTPPPQTNYGRIGRYSTPAATPAPLPATVAPPTQVGNGRTTMTR